MRDLRFELGRLEAKAHKDWLTPTEWERLFALKKKEDMGKLEDLFQQALGATY